MNKHIATIGLGLAALTSLTACGDVRLRSPIVTGPDATPVVARPAPAPKDDTTFVESVRGLFGGLPATKTQPNSVRPDGGSPVVGTPLATARPAVPGPFSSGQPAGPASSGGPSSCPTLDEMRKLAGVDVTRVGTEKCAWTYNRGDYNYADTIQLPQNFFVNVATIDSQLGEVVLSFEAKGGTCGNVKAATWRFKPDYPTLTLDQATQLLKNYAPSAGYDPSIIHQKGCENSSTNAASVNPPATATPAAAAQTGCPEVAGFRSEPIDGGCLYKASTPTRFQIPDGWYAHYGNPAKDVNGPNTTEPITITSMYRRQ